MNTIYEHTTVMRDDALKALHIKPDGLYVDATFGRGGHSLGILQQLTDGKLLVIDKDPDAIHMANVLQSEGYPIEIRHGSFAEMEHWLKEMDWYGNVDGILFDLGVSSPQIDDPERGFSFMKTGPLDMRMDPTQGMTAAQWLNTAKAEDIAHVLKEYGEERFAKRIANKIVQTRDEHPLETTEDLLNVIASAQPIKDKHKHFATRSFQAIRIFINEEITDIEKAIKQAIGALKKGGQLVVISFHSLEDRTIKRALKRAAKGKDVPYFIPLSAEDSAGEIKLLGKAKASATEVANNPRARSAMMRMAEKVV